MKKRYLMNMTARVMTLMLSFLCLAGGQQVTAQSRSMGGGTSSGGSSSSRNVSFVQNKYRSPMTKAGDEIDITVNSAKYTNWATALEAINNSKEAVFDIVLNANLTVNEMPEKACVFRSDQNGPKTFSFYDDSNTDNEYLMPMKGAVTFRNIKLNIFQILANGHTLTFDEGTDCSESGYSTNNGSNLHIGICNVWGGSNNNNVENTNITIKSGQFGWVHGGSCSTGDVTGISKVTMTGGTINGSIYGGGYNGTCHNTEVVISGGTVNWVFGGGEYGEVSNLAKVTVNDGSINQSIFGGSQFGGMCFNTEVLMTGGSAQYVYGGGDQGIVFDKSKLHISYNASVACNAYGGGYSGSCINTEVRITGGIFAGNIYGGGELGVVHENTNVEINGARMEPTESPQGVFSGCNIYGGGMGSIDGDGTKGQVGETRVVVKSLVGDSRNVGVYGGGLYSNVTGNTNVEIEDGDIDQVWAGGYNCGAQNAGKVKGDVNLLIRGGTINTVGAARVQDSGEPVPVDGQMNITIEGGEVTEMIQSVNEPSGSNYKECKLTIWDVGTDDAPFKLPTISAITDIVLENSTVAIRNPEWQNIRLHKNHPVTISGNGKLIGTNILLQKCGEEDLLANIPVVIADGLPATTTFANYKALLEGKPVTSPVYKAGNTYRLQKEGETLYTITMTKPADEIGTLSVVWDKVKGQDVKLEDGDQAPANTQLTVSFTPKKEGIKGILKNNGQVITSGELTLSDDANITVETEVLPLDLSDRKDDVTISKEGDVWQYTEGTITKAPAAAVPFNGTIMGSLAEGKRILIDKTAQGVLTFDNATINSTSTAAPALTIESGANVSFSGNLEVKTGNADQYAIRNDGSLTLTGASTQINSTNTNGGSDKGIQVGTDAVLVSEAGTALIASGLKNEGIVVVKEGAVAQTGGGQDLQKAYLVTVVDPGNGNLFTVKAGDIEIKSNDKVADKTVLTVQATAANGYRLESITATPKDGQAVTLVNNGTYQMTENEVTFKATFKSTYVPPVPTYYTVTLPEVEGATTNPKAGTRTVEEGYSFSFSLTLHEGYESSQPVVKANGRVVIPRESDGKYVIRNIGEDTEITIEGITKDDPTGNATIEGEIKVRAIGSALHIYLPKAETVRVYRLSGLLYEQKDLSAGNTQMQLSSGMYFVKIGEATYKIVIR